MRGERSPSFISKTGRGITAITQKGKICAMEMGEWIYIVIKYKRGKAYELLYRTDEIIGRGDSLRMACIMMAEEWKLGKILKWKRTKLYVLK